MKGASFSEIGSKNSTKSRYQKFLKGNFHEQLHGDFHSQQVNMDFPRSSEELMLPYGKGFQCFFIV